MSRASATLLAIAVFGACTRSSPPPGGTGSAPPSSSRHAAVAVQPSDATAKPVDLVAVENNGVTYDCGFVALPARAACRDPIAPEIHELVATEEAFLGVAASHFPPSAVLWKRAENAIAAIAKLDPEPLPRAERIVAQNAALFFAARDRDEHAALSRDAWRVVTRLALPAVDLTDAAPGPALRAWLGDPQAWIDKKRGVTDAHEQVHAYTQVFRAIAAGERRALFGQLVAIDQRGAPHLTPIVGTLELRRDHALDAPGCVALLDVNALRCGISLRPLAADELEAVHPFARSPHPGRVNCFNCHQASSVFTMAERLLASKVGPQLDRHRDESFARLSQWLGR